jgi:hypothetical protein
MARTAQGLSRTRGVTRGLSFRRLACADSIGGAVNNIIYIVGLIVVIVAILSFLGLR